MGSLLDCAVKYNIIEKKGAWYSYGEEKVGQGRDNAREYLEQRPEFALELEQRLRKQIFPGKEFPAAKAAPAAKSAPPKEAAQATVAPAAKPAAAPVQAAPAATQAAAAQGPGRPRKASPSGEALSEEALF
jgi:recombination protein RecA